MKISINNLMLSFIYILTMFVMMFDYENRLSILFPNVLLSLIVFLTIHNFKKISANKKKIFLMLLLTIFLFISILFNNGGFGSVELLLIIGFVLLQSDSIYISKGFRNAMMIITILLFQIFFFNKINDINSNVACYRMFLLFILCFCFIDSANIKRKKKILINLVFSLQMLYLSLYYDCRNIFVIAILLFVFTYFLRFVFKLKYSSLIVWLIITIGSIIIVYIYIYMYKNNIQFDLLSFSKKNFFSGREAIWSYMLSLFNGKSILIGIGSKAGIYGSLQQGLHNFMFSNMVLFGMPTLIVFSLLLKNTVDELFQNMNMQNISFVVSFISLYLIDFFETHLLNGYAISILLLILSFFSSIVIEDGCFNNKVKLEDTHEKKTKIYY